MSDSALAQPVPPLFVAEGWDITVYSSEAALNRDIEPWFPSEVEYRAFDSEGRRLELLVEDEKFPRRWLPDGTRDRIVVRAIESDPSHADELAELLAEWLARVGVEPAPDTDLDELVRLAIECGDLDP